MISDVYEKAVIPAGKRVSSAMDGGLRAIHAVWIPAIPAGMTAKALQVFLRELGYE